MIITGATLETADPEHLPSQEDGLYSAKHNSSNELSSIVEGPGNGDKRSVRGVRWAVTCVAIFSANVLYGLDNTIVADMQGAIAETYGEYSQIGWLGIGFTLGSVAFILPLGKAYAIFDVKWLFIGCLVMFAAGSALCGGAPNMNAIIVGRVWAGAGGAGMYLGNLNLLTILTTPKEQPVYVGLIGLIYGTGCILGPIVGGAFSDSGATWRWGSRHLSFSDKLLRLDWVGIALSIGIHLSLALCLTFGGVQWSWGDGRNIALYVVFGATLGSFIITQYFCVLTTKQNRLFPGEFLLSRSMVLLYILVACGGAALFVALYYIPLYFQFVHGDSGIMSAVRLLPFVCLYVITILLCGYLMPKTGYYMVWYLVSGASMLIGASLMYTVDYDTAPSKIYGYSILLGVGTTTTQAAYAVAPTLVAADRVTEAIQFINVSQGQGLLLGLTIASAIFQSLAFNGLNDLLAGTGASKIDIQGAIAGSKSELLERISPELRVKALGVIVKTIDNVYIMVIAAGALYVSVVNSSRTKGAWGVRTKENLLHIVSLGVTRNGATATVAVSEEVRKRGIGNESVKV
ncbi:MFS transporter, putative [Paecilomyces variotii No. 5]|uniref:MFS transporter, putative n=1 Tax=Byssochlamys spectabilis (strain No. 5 / NBRC 109023) TaxID=1356009 RepID=V5I263_BYSSN|nr:MFS transporter, putative [Paecilomyces variotii No. 5]